MADFGDIRSLLQRPPSAENWRTLCGLLDQFPIEQLQQRILPYVNGYMRHWPDHLRIAPKQWIRNYFATNQAPQLSVARCIKTSNLTQDDLLKLAQCKDVDILDGLYLQNCYFSPALIETLLKSPICQHLKTLYIAHSYLNEQELKQLCEIKHLEQLTTLDLRYNRIDDKGAKHLAECPHLSNLDVLDLRYNTLGIDGTTALVESATLSNIKKLDLQNNALTESDVHALLKNKRFCRIATVEVVSYDISPEVATNLVERDLQTLAQSQPSSVIWKQVCKLIDKIPYRYLTDAFIGWMDDLFVHWPDHLRILTDRWQKHFVREHDNPKYTLIRHLTLPSNAFYYNQDMLSDVLSSASLTQITALNMSGANLGPGRAIALINAKILKNLKHLTLSHCQLRGHDLIELMKQPWFKNLETLLLDHNFLGNRCIEALCQIPFEHLKELSLAAVGINANGVEHIVNGEYFEDLHKLNLNGNRLNQHSKQLLEDATNLPERVKKTIVPSRNGEKRINIKS